MEVTEILSSQCIRIYSHPTSALDDNVRDVALVRAIEARYGFYQAPRVVEDFDLAKGVTFLRGQFSRKLLITKFQIFQKGILVEGKGRTDELDAFLDDLTNWVNNEFKSPNNPNFMRAYLSQVEVRLDVTFSDVFERFSEFYRDLESLVRSYGQNTAAIEATKVEFFTDVESVSFPKIGVPFSITRREGQKFESNLFFASAPLKSSDHYKLLEKFEQALEIR